MTLEIIDWLKQTSREPAAKRLFEKVYVQSRAQLDAAETRDLPGMQNDLAWLCARAGERLDEAHELALAAVEASPEHAAFLDTLAEVQFRRGHAAEAAEIEEKALSLSPENDFMREQLQRFRAGVKATSQGAKSSPSPRDD
jgi:tetratricopeptide (TPR) repeat protein